MIDTSVDLPRPSWQLRMTECPGGDNDTTSSISATSAKFGGLKADVSQQMNRPMAFYTT